MTQKEFEDADAAICKEQLERRTKVATDVLVQVLMLRARKFMERKDMDAAVSEVCLQLAEVVGMVTVLGNIISPAFREMSDEAIGIGHAAALELIEKFKQSR